ncbi:two-component sensor histidine kinase [Sinosporangium siamense]|uniref:histidine kinase n=1 Tax=Sinosporangium siamense TaxID=1367973 RepID=A0A919RJM3_9ACTN|nr:two-component sensor histidine kinase [Sinosporangium siamense]
MLDGLIALLIAAAVIAMIAGSEGEAGAKPPNALAYAMGLAMGAVLIFRREWPLPVLVASCGLVLAYHSLAYPSLAIAIILGVATYTAAERGHFGWAAAVVGALTLYSMGYRAFVVRDSMLTLILEKATLQAALLAAALFLGETTRSRRALAEEVRERLRRAREDREAEAERRIEAERLRIARELHDVIAHTITVIQVQAKVAVELFDEKPEQSRHAMGVIGSASSEAMSELRSTINLLRQVDMGQELRAPVSRLSNVDDLVGMAQKAGLTVGWGTSGEVYDLPAAVDASAYRIIQESMTNVIRHSGATTAKVTMVYEPQGIAIEIVDNGRGSGVPDGGTPGHGLTGMRERVAALGGHLAAGPAPDGGFRVHAWLPTEGRGQ